MTTTTAPTRRLTADTAQTVVLVIIVLVVGFMAGKASFTHVHDWTLDNSKAGTADWFGWANAVISELIPTAAIIEIGRRRRRDKDQAKIGYPMTLLVGAVLFSLTAQLAEAKPGPSGWIVAALPALAFLGLSKLVFSATAARPTHPVTASTPATSPATSSDTTRAQVTPVAAPKTRATPAKKATLAKKTTPARRTPAKKTTAPAAPATITPEPALVTAPALAVRSEDKFSDLLLANARTIAVSHRAEHGEDINANQMAVRLKVPTLIATDILTQLRENLPPASTTAPHNGRTVGAPA